MNIVHTQIQNIRPDPKGHQMLGNVTFYISGGLGSRQDIANYECACPIPTRDMSSARIKQINTALRNDALRQARRMPEVCSGEDMLVFLSPCDQDAA